jgi:hypothetical protein
MVAGTPPAQGRFTELGRAGARWSVRVGTYTPAAEREWLPLVCETRPGPRPDARSEWRAVMPRPQAVGGTSCWRRRQGAAAGAPPCGDCATPKEGNGPPCRWDPPRRAGGEHAMNGRTISEFIRSLGFAEETLADLVGSALALEPGGNEK